MCCNKPLCVDMDGTLIRDDVTLMAIGRFVLSDVKNMFSLLLWLLQGRAYMKHMLAQYVNIDPKNLNYNTEFLQYIKQEKSNGRSLYLATGSTYKYANEVADFLNIFDDVFASDSVCNLIADKKAAALVDKFGKYEFDYAGNSVDDVKIWDNAHAAILVAPDFWAQFKMRNKQYRLFK